MHVLKFCHNYFKPFKINSANACLSDQLRVNGTRDEAAVCPFAQLSSLWQTTWQSKRAAVWKLHTVTAQQNTCLHCVFCHSVSDGICSWRNLQSSPFILGLYFTTGIKYIFPDGYFRLFPTLLLPKMLLYIKSSLLLGKGFPGENLDVQLLCCLGNKCI